MTLRLDELVDVSTFPPAGPDGELRLDLTGQRITGARVALEWVARSWFTPRGALPRNKARGVDLRALENATVDAADLERWRAALVAEAEAVEYVRRCEVSLELVAREVRLDARVQLVDGRTFPLAVRLRDAVALVSVGGT